MSVFVCVRLHVVIAVLFRVKYFSFILYLRDIIVYYDDTVGHVEQ